jgi:hypothetical protein
MAMAVGLGFASVTADPFVKMAAICIASWGLWSIPPVFFTRRAPVNGSCV